MQRSKFALLTLAIFLMSGLSSAIQPTAAASYNNVQVFANLPTSQSYSFQFAAYNLSGSLVASYQGPYPAAAFELPSGGYLFTASATHFPTFKEYPCPVEGAATPPAAPASKSTNGPAILPIGCYPPSSEYGYQTATITGSQTINLQMQNVSKLSTEDVTVKVSYVNGTAASNASVYASIVGEWSYWWYQDNGISMYAQTDNNGVAHLVIPAAPAVVTAWKWVPIFADRNGTNIQVNVGGEKVNVTVYWQPTYVGLSGSGLILPPQNSISLTLHYQQPNYWVMPAGVVSQGASAQGGQGATAANQPTGTPSLASSGSGAQGQSQYYLPSQIPSIQQAAQVPTAGADLASAWTLGAVVAIIAIAGIAVALIAVRRRQTGRLP